MITAQDIKTTLVNELVGKEYHQYNVDYDVLRCIRTLVSKDVAGELYTNLDHQDITLKYKQHCIGVIKVKKAKGASHYMWGERWCDWTNKDFTVDLYKDSLEECFEMVENDIIKETAKANDIKANAEKIIKLIKENTNYTDIYSIAKICKYINDNKYSLDRD